MDRLEESNIKLAVQVAKNSELIKNLVTRDEFNKFKNELWVRLDKMMAILIRLDQERIISTKRVDRLEKIAQIAHPDLWETCQL